MEFRILGSFEVIANGVLLRLGRRRQRELLAYLLVHAGTPIATDRIVEDLWGDARPEQAENVLRVLVSRLRAALKPVEIVSTAGGYVLELRGRQVDARRFEQLVVEGRGALRAGDADAAASKLHEGLALWRGSVLADLPHAEFAQVQRERLEELRLAPALETRIEAELALGRHREIVAELDALVAAHPLRERLHSQRMLALYRSGRQAEARSAYQEAHDKLVEELVVRDRTLTQLEDVLGAAAVEVARSEGAELTLDQALDEAAAQASRARVAAPGEP